MREAYDPQSLKYLLSGPLQKMFVKPCSKNRIGLIKPNIQILKLLHHNDLPEISPSNYFKVASEQLHESTLVCWLLVAAFMLEI